MGRGKPWTRYARVGMLAVIGLVSLASVAGWTGVDLWILFVCVIALMGVGTRGGSLDSVNVVALEGAVVVVLGLATFSGSEHFVWAAATGISIVALGKIAFVQLGAAGSGAGRDGATPGGNSPEEGSKPAPD